MADTKTVTVDGLIAEYAEPLAKAVGITVDDHYRTPEGFIQLLGNVAARLSPDDQTRSWLGEAAVDLNAIQRTRATGKQARRLLRHVDRLLYEAREDLELS